MEGQSEEIEVTVNGERRRVPAGATVALLLERLGLGAGSGVAVERNRRIVRRADWERERLAPGDELEIVTLVGGG